MTLFRVEHNRNYTCINNTIAKDKRLSWKAKGIYLYAFTRPNDWEFHLNDLINQSTDGRESVKAGLKELEECGYLERSQQREGGQFSKAEWVFYEIPKEIKIISPKAENPSTVNPSSGNRPLLSTEFLPSNEKKQQQPAAVFSKPAKKEQASPTARISPLLVDVSIPQVDKAYLSEKYDDGTISTALAWSRHPDTKPIKELAAALKWACENKIQPPKDKVPEKSKVDVAPYNRSFWREIHKNLVVCGYRLPIVYMPNYLEIPNGKIYFEDISFLEQVENYLRKNISDLKVFDFVKNCQKSIKDHI
jgi:hypothetical protein